MGGGFAGATCARALKRIDPRTTVTLVEASQTFTACPFSNNVIAGLRDLKAQQFDYKKFAADRSPSPSRRRRASTPMRAR